jgi:hypothetical protein
MPSHPMLYYGLHWSQQLRVAPQISLTDEEHSELTRLAQRALNVLDGQDIGQCQQRHTHVEWLKFLRQIDRQTPQDKTLHLIADNYATHKHPAVLTQ